ncbi:hypothetical protein [Eubacterium sp. F2]|uniref:hypothetical protein n=1 Tax=Eubacterium sp. F2 TaxID=3381348 RepID=UPI003908012E
MNLPAILFTILVLSFSLLLLTFTFLGFKLLLDLIREDKRKAARRALRQNERDA